jgi:hypothetical protein
MDEQLIKDLLEANNKASEELKKLLPKEELNENEVSPAVKNALDWQKQQDEKKEKEIKKNGYYNGY